MAPRFAGSRWTSDQGSSLRISAGFWQADGEEREGVEVSYKKLSDEEKLDMDEAMVKELSQVRISAALRKATEAELEGLDSAMLLRMRWLLAWKIAEDDTKKAKARLVALRFQRPGLTELNAAARILCRIRRQIVLQAMALHGFDVESGDITAAFLQRVWGRSAAICGAHRAT